jgi:hypothetical protein
MGKTPLTEKEIEKLKITEDHPWLPKICMFCREKITGRYELWDGKHMAHQECVDKYK